MSDERQRISLPKTPPISYRGPIFAKPQPKNEKNADTIAAIRRLWLKIRGESTAATFWRRAVESLPFVVRAVVLLAIAMPYLMASVLTYRPKIVATIDPQSQYGFDFDRVRFETADGFSIAGWWIPGKRPPGHSRATW